MQDAGEVSESWNLALDSTPPWFLPACNGGAHPCPEPLQSIPAETGGEGLIPFALPRVLAGVLRVALVCMRNSVPHRVPGAAPQGAVALVVGYESFGLPLVGLLPWCPVCIGVSFLAAQLSEAWLFACDAALRTQARAPSCDSEGRCLLEGARGGLAALGRDPRALPRITLEARQHLGWRASQ